MDKAAEPAMSSVRAEQADARRQRELATRSS